MARNRKTTSTPKLRLKNGPGAMAPTARPLDSSGIQRVVREAISSGEIISVGVLNLVRNTLIAALAGVRDVGGEIGAAAVTAVRGSIKATDEIGADLGAVAKQAIIGTIEAAEAIGGELGGVAKSTAQGAVRATGEVGGDVGKVARKAVEGTAEAARTLGLDGPGPGDEQRAGRGGGGRSHRISRRPLGSRHALGSGLRDQGARRGSADSQATRARPSHGWAATPGGPRTTDGGRRGV